MGKHTVLIPLDGSTLSTQILPTVERFFTPATTKLLLFQTIEEPILKRADVPVNVALAAIAPVAGAKLVYKNANPIEHYYKIEGELLEQHRQALSEVAHELKLKGFDSQIEVTVGDPTELILQRADDGDIDIIAMATHGRSGLSRMVMGSVAEKVMHRASVPVLLLRPQEK